MTTVVQKRPQKSQKKNTKGHKYSLRVEPLPLCAKPVAELLADLGVTKTHSRPHISNYNPFSEAQFKTLKYWPEFPKRFGSLPDARSFCREILSWYNYEHHHTGIGLLTPMMVHYGEVPKVIAARDRVLRATYMRPIRSDR